MSGKTRCTANENAPPAAGPRVDATAGAKRRHKQVLATEDLPEWLIERIASAEMDPAYDHLDDE